MLFPMTKVEDNESMNRHLLVVDNRKGKDPNFLSSEERKEKS